VGRIDLVRRLDTDETTIVDLKTSERSQQENITEMQLHIYVVGHEELTGRTADFVEIYELDERKRKPRSVDGEFVDDVKEAVRDAAITLRGGSLEPKPALELCKACDYRHMCTIGSDLVSSSASG
jgi:DNA helicase-2/ATP-dependent DNA helicase PcrA